MRRNPFLLLFLFIILALSSNEQANLKRNAAYSLLASEQNSLKSEMGKKAVLKSQLVDDMADGKRSLRGETSVRNADFLALPGNRTICWGLTENQDQ